MFSAPQNSTGFATMDIPSMIMDSGLVTEIPQIFDSLNVTQMDMPQIKLDDNLLNSNNASSQESHDDVDATEDPDITRTW